MRNVRHGSVGEQIKQAAPHVFEELSEKVCELGRRRLHAGGKKSYDILVAGYFNDIAKVFQQVKRVLKPKADFVLVLGDSAPYGVYIPTESYLGEIALGLGFSQYQVFPLRRRGEKWASNPQRHQVPLKESLLIQTNQAA